MKLDFRRLWKILLGIKSRGRFMSTKKNNKMLWEQVREEDDVGKAIRLIAEITECAIDDRLTVDEELRQAVLNVRLEAHEELKEIRKILLGNGDPSHSIISRLERIETKAAKSAESANKALWIVAGVVITQIVLYILQVL